MRHFISIVLPVFNEEENIITECTAIKKYMDSSGHPYEIIIVDDCSTDNSYKIACGLGFVRLIRLDKRMGTGFARKTGTLNSGGDIIVWTDCDSSYPHNRIPQMIEEMVEQDYDQVIGARNVDFGKRKHLKLYVKAIINSITSILVAKKIPDLNSGMRVFKKKDGLQYFHLLPNGFSCMATMTLSFILGGQRVFFMPIPYSERKGISKFHPIFDTIRYILQILKMVAYFKL